MEIIQEGKIIRAKETLPLSKTELKQKSNYICKIVSRNKLGTGFFCNIPYKDKNIPVLITNYHIIDDNFLKDNKQMTIYINDDMKKINISNRKIYSSPANEFDMMILQLKEEDEIYNYLEIEQNIFKNNAINLFRNEPIYILHYPYSKEPSISYGNGIEKINEYDIKHLCNTDNGSSGAPILNTATDKIIGIHKGFIQKKQFNIGTFLKFPLDELNKNSNKQNDRVQQIFQSDSFNSLNTNEFEDKFKYESDYSILKSLKEIYTDIISGSFKLTRNMLDNRGNRFSGWSINEKRGNKPYYSPIGWIGFGLKVIEKYENDYWLGNNNSPDEWCVAYHGVGHRQASDSVKNIIGKIIQSTFKPGPKQTHRNCQDRYHPGQIVGDGIYCAPKIETTELYAGISEINGKNYKSVLMVRVKPSAIRNCYQCPDTKDDNYWVVNGITDEIRPYRILFKEVEE